MTTSSVHRSFAITLAIAFTTVGPGASGFAINRTNSNFTTLSTDLSSDESFSVQVANDSKKLNDFTIENEYSNRTTNSDVSNDVIEKVSETLEVETEKNSNSTQIPITIRTTTEFMKIPTISSDTVEVFDSTEDIEKLDNSKEFHNNKVPELNNTENSTASKQTTAKISIFEETVPSLELVTFVHHVGTESVQLGEKLTQETVTQSIIDNKETTQLYDVPVIPMTIETATEILPVVTSEEIKLHRTELSSLGTDLPQIVSYSSNTSASINGALITTESSNIYDSDVTQTTEDVNTKITGKSSETDGKYTGIMSKQTTIPEATATSSEKEVNEMKAENSNTRVNFEKVFDVTPIPSLEQLRTDLLSNTNQPFISSELSQRTKKVSREVELTTPYAIKSTEPKIVEKIETKRAGYLDNSEKTTTPVITYSSEEVKEKVTEMYGTAKDNVTMVTESPDNKTVSSSESQRQLADDELLEQFLKEEALNNHKENSIRYHVEQTAKLVNIDNSGSPPGTEDSLSVQPIERTKTTLYTVSPNYKPMKKIDVQPAKPFIRDPDDNSWRNESISSLGIVFKPKNSSKSFKEVLKNKTQTELNSLVERTKDEVPDLRVRLEKIAEVRKTKKKKMNNDGEIFYSDYGENSAETNTKPPELNYTILNSADIAKMLTPSNSHPKLENKIEVDVTTPMTTVTNMEESKDKPTDKLDIFSKLGLDQLTTQKPKKFFNIAEYYDTTDEYDADYVSMSKLDLKKFTTPYRSSPSTPLITKPVVSYIPERRPTVQYFPPRDPTVNVNNVDRDFERKINMFTLKELPRVETPPPFVTLPPLTIATTKPELRPLLPMRSPNASYVMRPTVKPTDLMYPPEINKNYYITNTPPTTESEDFLINSGRVDRGSYVIKHYKDFLNAAVDDVERNADFLPFHTTQTPREKFPTEGDKQTFRPRDDEEDYDTRFRKEVLSRFVENFNQNSERFKVDFPILYNNSIVHRDGEESPASSRTFLKRLYHEGGATTATGLVKKPCEPNCELTVELSPAYELHYYVPNQEEKEEQQPRSSPLPYRYRL